MSRPLSPTMLKPARKTLAVTVAAAIAGGFGMALPAAARSEAPGALTLERSTPRVASDVRLAQRSPDQIIQDRREGRQSQRSPDQIIQDRRQQREGGKPPKQKAPEARKEQRQERRQEQRQENRVEQRRERRQEQRQENRVEQRQERRQEQRQENRVEQRQERRQEQRQDRRDDRRDDARASRAARDRIRAQNSRDRQNARRDIRDGRRDVNRGLSRIIRQSLGQPVRSRVFRDARGREREIRSRRYRRADNRFRNQFRNGRSIYWLAPVAGLAISSYILSAAASDYDDYYSTFRRGPLVAVNRRYALDEIIEDPSIRNTIRPVSLDVVTFASGSAEVSNFAFDKLEDLADAMLESIEQNRDQVFLVEGHTDAVGDDDYNLELSEERAASVVNLMISVYGIPGRNLEAVGYGEEYLLVNTEGDERRNRRVVIRAIGPILAGR